MLSRAAVRTCLALALMASPALAPRLLAQEADDKPTPSPETPAPPAKPAPVAKTPPPPAQAPAPVAVPVPPPPRRGQPVNVRIDVKITDLRGSQPVASKSVSLTVADSQNGSARTTVEAPYGKSEV